MAGSRERRSRRRQLQASHQKNWLIGRHAVVEALTAGHWPVQDLYLSDDLSQDSTAHVRQLAAAAQLRLLTVTPQRIAELCHSEHHQGIAARMGPFPYGTLESLLSSVSARPDDAVPPPLIVICDRIQDSFNFGAILRCCDGLGASAVLIGDADQVGVTPQVARSSAGAVNYVPVVVSEDLSQAAAQLSKAGFLIAAASEKSAVAAWDADLNRPVALVIGSEAQGVSSQLLQQCSQVLRIPMSGRVASMNAAVAAGILLYEIRRQQNATGGLPGE